MLRNTAEPKVTTRSQKSYRGAKFPAAEPFHIYRGTKRHAAEPNILPRNQKSYRGAVIYLPRNQKSYRGANINLPRNRHSRAENFCTFGLQYCADVLLYSLQARRKSRRIRCAEGIDRSMQKGVEPGAPERLGVPVIQATKKGLIHLC